MSAASAEPRVMVLQDGARRRFAVPKALHQAGMLAGVLVDYYHYRGGLDRVTEAVLRGIQPSLASKLAGRRDDALPDHAVHRAMGVTMRSAWMRRRLGGGEAFFDWHRRAMGQRLVRLVERQMARGEQPNAAYVFVRNADPQALRRLRELGLKLIGDQIIAPAEVEKEELRKQVQRFPQWATSEEHEDWDRRIAVERATWAELNAVISMSDYVTQSLKKVGVPDDKIRDVPYPFDLTDWPAIDRGERGTGPLTVGFIGTVNLRKGIPYWLEVARRFDPRRVRFVLVGPLGVPQEVFERSLGPVEYAGPVPRRDVRTWLERFDVFYFPSTCEGSAGVVMEAMACGLPIITSPNAGSLVRDGVEGMVIAYDDVPAATAAIEQLHSEADLCLSMGQAARQRVTGCGMLGYSITLASIIHEVTSVGGHA